MPWLINLRRCLAYSSSRQIAGSYQRAPIAYRPHQAHRTTRERREGRLDAASSPDPASAAMPLSCLSGTSSLRGCYARVKRLRDHEQRRADADQQADAHAEDDEREIETGRPSHTPRIGTPRSIP
jgi:hypothetical protein